MWCASSSARLAVSVADACLHAFLTCAAARCTRRMACTTRWVAAFPASLLAGGGRSPATSLRIASAAYGPALAPGACPSARSACFTIAHAPRFPLPPRVSPFRRPLAPVWSSTGPTSRTAAASLAMGCPSASCTASHSPHIMWCDVAIRSSVTRSPRGPLHSLVPSFPVIHPHPRVRLQHAGHPCRPCRQARFLRCCSCSLFAFFSHSPPCGASHRSPARAAITMPTLSSSGWPPPCVLLSSSPPSRLCSSVWSLPWLLCRPRAPVRCHTASHCVSCLSSHSGPRQSLRIARPCCESASFFLICHPVASLIATNARASHISHVRRSPSLMSTSCTTLLLRMPSCIIALTPGVACGACV